MIKLLSAIWFDARIAGRHLWLNTVAGSVLIPRPVRWMMWRAGGIDTRSMSLFSGVTVTGTGIRIGERSFLNHGVYLDSGSGHITIGDDTLIGPQVMILTATHRMADGQVDHRATNLDVVIGNRVWMGARVTVLPGVTVGDGCVIAAGAVVTKDCEPGGVYAGLPARRIRSVAKAA
jgi:acetyltransferase-like isoleucine patch superfamily enzyme